MKPRQREAGARYRVYTPEEFLAGADAPGDWTAITGVRSPGRAMHRLAGAAALGGAVGAVGSVLALAGPQAHPVARATIAPEFVGPRPIARTSAIVRSAGPLRRRSPRPRRTRDKPGQLAPRSNRATSRRSNLDTRPLATAVAASAVVPPASNATTSPSIPAGTGQMATAQAPEQRDTRRAPAEPEPPRLPRSEFGFER